jgi:hypothetical protein
MKIKSFMQSKKLSIYVLLFLVPILMSWGIFGHEHINRAAVLSLPDPLRTFFFNHIDFMTEESSVPDLRKYTLNDQSEKPRHFIDLENFCPPDSLPVTLSELKKKYDENFLQQNGILPWYIEEMMHKLTLAMKEKRKTEILFLAADLGHYIGDAYMPLHTTVNHDGQLTDQKGIHAFWESQLPEMFGDAYNYNAGEAVYISDIHEEIWSIINTSHSLVDTLLLADKELKLQFPAVEVYAKDDSGTIVNNRFHSQVHSLTYARLYNQRLNNMVENQMRAAIRATASFWFTAWVNAGKPDLSALDPKEQTVRNKNTLLQELQLFMQGKLTDIRSEKEF